MALCTRLPRGAGPTAVSWLSRNNIASSLASQPVFHDQKLKGRGGRKPIWSDKPVSSECNYFIARANHMKSNYTFSWFPDCPLSRGQDWSWHIIMWLLSSDMIGSAKILAERHKNLVGLSDQKVFLLSFPFNFRTSNFCPWKSAAWLVRLHS